MGCEFGGARGEGEGCLPHCVEEGELDYFFEFGEFELVAGLLFGGVVAFALVAAGAVAML